MNPAEKQARYSTRDHLRALVSGLPDKRRRSRRLMMLQGFIDDSGNDGKSPVFVLAGFMSSVERWEAFSDEWDRVLKPADGFQLEVLKMTDVYRNRVRGARYYGWPDDDRDDRLKKLIKVINTHAMHGIISVIPYEPFNRIIKGKFNPHSLDRPYFLSFFGVMTQLFKVTHSLKIDDKVEFIFDTQDSENKPLLMAEYERFISAAPPEVQAMSAGYPNFKRDEDFSPLQAADMLAWHARKYYVESFHGRDPTKDPSHPYLANLLMPEHDIIDIWDEARIKAVVDILEKTIWSKKMGEGVPMTVPDFSGLRSS